MFVCWYFKLKSGLILDDGRPLTAAMHRHATNCLRCRNSWMAQQELMERLRGASRETVPPPTPRLAGRIMGEIRQDSRPVSRDDARPAHWQWVLAALAAVGVVLAFGMVGPRERRSVRNPGVIGPQASVSALHPSKTTRLAMGEASGSDLLQWSRPLEGELQALAMDARSALDLLAHDFVPRRFSGDGSTGN